MQSDFYSIDGSNLSYRDIHEIMTKSIITTLQGLVSTDRMPTLTLMKKDTRSKTHYRYRLDFTDADEMFGKCEYPIELFLKIVAYELTLYTRKPIIAIQPYWDYDNVNKFVRSISFALTSLNTYDPDADDYTDILTYEDVMLYAHK